MIGDALYWEDECMKLRKQQERLLEVLIRAEHLAKNVPVFSDLLPSMRAAIKEVEDD